jgi:hypothetical protein
MAVTRRQLQDDAVKKLAKYNPAVTNADFIASLLSGGAENAALEVDDLKSDASKKFANIANSFVDIINGGTYTLDAIGEMDDYLNTGNNSDDTKITNALRRFLRITLSKNQISSVAGKPSAKIGLISGARSFGEDTTGNNSLFPGVYNEGGTTGFYTLEAAGFEFNSSPNAQNIANNPDTKPASKTSPYVSVIELLDSRIGPAVRDTAALSIFTSMIPTQMMSKAVPYVSVSVISSGSNTKGGGGQQPFPGNFNIVRYLRGKQPVASNVFRPLVTLAGGGQKPGGMELFTSPQTLISDFDDMLNGDFFTTKPVDMFRPLLTLTNLGVTVVSAGAGMMSYKNASMKVVLHDRGRLEEIAPLVQPGAYKDTEIEIEYGWSVDPGSKNAKEVEGKLSGFALEDDVFSQFLDSMRCRERFGVVNSSFDFDDAGQVNIDLTLFTKGVYDLRSLDISSTSSKDVAAKLKKTIEDINGIISTTPGVTNFLSEIIFDAASSAEGAIALDKDKLKELGAEIDKLKKTADKKGSALAGLVEKLRGLTSTVGEFATASESGVDQIIQTLNSGKEIFPPTAAIAASGDSKTKWEDFSKGSYSLGRVILHLVAKVLANTSKFDEIQLVFGKINSRAGNVRNLSMAAFPLDADKLDAMLKKLYKGNLKVSAEMLISLIGVDHVSNPGYPAYGMSAKYKDGELIDGVKEGDIDAILKKAGISDGNFVLPKLYFHAECVPASPTSANGTGGGTILRLFVGDEACSPYQGYAELVNIARTDSSFLMDFEALDGKEGSKSKNLNFANTYWADLDPNAPDSRSKTLEVLRKKGAIITAAQKASGAAATDEIDLTKLFSVKDPKSVKKFISEGLPVIRYGNSAGTIKNMSVMSISDPALATINIIAADEASDDGVAAAKKKGLPMIVTPTEVTIDLLGCPLINFGQSVYIDFGTGTTIDNIYGCNSVTHTFSPGEFSTQAKFHINVGAYGVYNSVSRQLKILEAKTNDVEKNNTP